MRILVASDKFKGSLTAVEANDSIASGLKAALNDRIEIQCAPIADGGDGLVATLVSALGGRVISREVTGPLGHKVSASFGILNDRKTAIIEMAEASGIALLDPAERNPDRASTIGTGELIKHAVEEGCSKIILGIGGSATNDGGAGMAYALGFRFYDEAGNSVSDLPAKLSTVTRITPPDDLALPEIEVACDVTNPLTGPDGCTRVYGPQKGITGEEMAMHESRLQHLASLFGERGATAAIQPGAGAAGGLGFGCLVFTKATLTPGFDLVANAVGLEEKIKWADYVITGEGKLDVQSLQGKGPGGVAALARKFGKPVSAFCGSADGDALSEHFDEIIEIRSESLTLSESMDRGFELLSKAAETHAEKLLFS